MTESQAKRWNVVNFQKMMEKKHNNNNIENHFIIHNAQKAANEIEWKQNI